MAAAITVENVIQAVETLYNSNDGSAKEAASAWLQEFQNSVSVFFCEMIYIESLLLIFLN